MRVPTQDPRAAPANRVASPARGSRRGHWGSPRAPPPRSRRAAAEAEVLDRRAAWTASRRLAAQSLSRRRVRRLEGATAPEARVVRAAGSRAGVLPLGSVATHVVDAWIAAHAAL